MNIKLVIILVLFFSEYGFSQVENTKWTKNDIIPYKNIEEPTNLNWGNEVIQYPVYSFVNLYKIIFSDIDGDNCPFTPSCSSFFIQAVNRTNVITGTLMFFDRFTRDMNFVNRNNKYSVVIKHHYYDPVDFYLPKPIVKY